MKCSLGCAGCGEGADHTPLVQLGLNVENFDHVVALAGNPNTGKSTVFNALTGLKQHTGNWPGKTVSRAEGGFVHDGRRFKLVDLPGTYSLLSASVDEEIARDFILFGQPGCVITVVDATALERNLNLVLQVMEITPRVVVCVNLLDEARRKRIAVDIERLADQLGVPAVGTSARSGEGLRELIETVDDVVTGRVIPVPRLPEVSPVLNEAIQQVEPLVEQLAPGLPNRRWVAVRLLEGDHRIRQALESGQLAAMVSGLSRQGDRAGPAEIACADSRAELADPSADVEVIS